MYSKRFPFKDFADKPHNETVYFNLTEREVFKLLKEFKLIFEWRDSLRGPERELDTDEVIEFYTAIEEVLLSAWGIPSDDGLHFRKAGKYEFEESALFNACMMSFVQDPQELGKLLSDVLPKGLEEVVRKQAENIEKMEGGPDLPESVTAELTRLRALAAEQSIRDGEKKD